MQTAHKATERGAWLRLLPCALFLLIMTAMTAAAEGSGEREIIFPEAAAIALGALVAPRLAWRTDKGSILLSIALCACLGVLIVRTLPLPLEWQLLLAYFVGQIVLIATRTGFAPLISAIVLPVLLQTRTLVYPVAAIVLTAVILLARCLSERLRLRPREGFSPLPPPGRGDLLALALRTLLAAAMCPVAVRTGWRFLVCPPLLVAFTEFSRPQSAAMRTPVRTVLLLGGCAAIGAATRLLGTALGLPLALPALAASALLLLVLLPQRLFLPPAAAVTLLAMLLPASDLALYPVQVLCGAAIYVLAALLLFRRRPLPT